MNQFTCRELSEGVFVRDFTNRKFKTMRISINMVFPLRVDRVSAAAMLPSLLTRATEDYPEMMELSKRLAELYGASLDCSVSKMGDNQVISISAGGISDKYALDGENMVTKLTELLCSSVFKPLKDSCGLVPQESFRQEKRQLIETIDSDYNDKRIYAKSRLIEIMYSGEPAGILRYGTKESVNRVERQELFNVLEDILKTARIEIFTLGDCDYNAAVSILEKYFCFPRQPVSVNSLAVTAKEVVTEKQESQAVAQSKLVMGFRTGVTAEDSTAIKVMTVIFGGSPSSKLFVNVREKQSLCYYCVAGLNIEKGTMIVESGVETLNAVKARDAILNQLETMKKGEFTQEDLDFAKLYILNGYNGVKDSLGATESWYMNRVMDGKILTPEEMAEEINAVSLGDVIEAANKINLDTVFTLKGAEA